MAMAIEPSPEGHRGSAPTEVDVDIEKGRAVAPIEKVDTEDEFPSLKRTLLIMPAIYLSMFLVALVRCPWTARPQILWTRTEIS